MRARVRACVWEKYEAEERKPERENRGESKRERERERVKVLGKRARVAS